MKIGVIGFGSIGRRHCENLIRLGYHDITLLRERSKGNDLNLKELFSEEEFLSVPFDFVILSNPTALHFKFLSKLIPRQLNLLVEKPISANRDEADQLNILLQKYKGLGLCAYNLRFHPCVKKVSELLEDNYLGKIYSARFFVGQYLPDWRPGSDYRYSYSASKSMGGGVVLDLIHEIDMAAFLCGNVKNSLHAIVDKVSDLEIETEDIVEVHYRSKTDALISIHMDYLLKGYSRHFEIICKNGSIDCDLFNAVIKIYRGDNLAAETIDYSNDFSRNEMYLAMMEYYIQCIKNKIHPRPSFTEGLASLETALAIKSQFRLS